MPSRPDFSQIDAWGLTHRGRVRSENQDCFFAGAVVDGETVHALPIDDPETEQGAQRLASLAVVADGVGGVSGGAEAARVAVRDLVEAVTAIFRSGTMKDEDPEVVTGLLHDAALSCHESLVRRSQEEGGGRRFATTLTLFLGLWPHAYLLQVGDSRCYLYRDGRLTQISRDQTLAEELVQSGVLTRTMAEKSRWSNVLSSAIGGEQAVPVVTRVVRDWGSVILLCSDGLTKHVPDEHIRTRLAGMTTSREVAEQLLQDALDDGGSDNITIVVGRSVKE